MNRRVFLTTRWSHLAMLNYEVEPSLLQVLVPRGTQLDLFEDRAFVSMVGFLYHDTRVLGLPVPYHRHFPEVNLRFYVRRQGPEGWRRGVVFVKEIVPRRAIAWVARWIYDEPFVRLPMRHEIVPRKEASGVPGDVAYRWYHAGAWQRLAVETVGGAELPAPGSEEEFITEHYWGYTQRRDGSTSEYEVDHPSWRVWQVGRAKFACDVASLYGKQFVEPLSVEPSSAFLAEGSDVTVYRGRRLG